MDVLQKTNVEGLVKDQATGAVLNTNVHELDSYRMMIRRAKEAKDLKGQVAELSRKVEQLELTVNHLMTLVQGINGENANIS